MSYAQVSSAQTSLLAGTMVSVEVDISRGLHSFSIVGLPDKAVEESKDRVSASIKNIGFKSPKAKNEKVVVSLAPADVKKEGPLFDLPIALAYLLASGEIIFSPKKKVFVGELSLDGRLCPIHGALALAQTAKKSGAEELYVPAENATEAALVSGIAVFAVHHLKDIILHLNEKKEEEGENDEDAVIQVKKLSPVPETVIVPTEQEHHVDFGDVVGQESAKRGLEIAAAGRHNIALFGPPGTGKTMLARAFTSILPPLSHDETLEVTAIHSIQGALREGIISVPPFRAPHHTSSYVSLVGGGAVPRPGEITLAHRGVLFLDEFPEFDRKVIEALREPLEERRVRVSRARGSASFPADCIFVCAMNPCPCGNFGITGKECVCSALTVERYHKKISGPIIDRIDMWVEVSKVDHKGLSSEQREPQSGAIASRVRDARLRQKNRFEKVGKKWKTNSDIPAKDLIKESRLSKSAQDTLAQSSQKLDLSARAHGRVVRLARTIADLEGSDTVESAHIYEALQYRPKKMQ